MAYSNSRFSSPGKTLAATALTLALAAAAPSALAFDESVDALLDALKAKGALSEEEYNQMKADREEQRKEERAERRKRALREAVAVEKEEKEKEDSKTALKGRFRDGFSFESGDKKNSIAITGRIHGDYRSYDVTSSGATTADTFDVRRAYLGISGRIAQDFTFEVTADVAQTAAPQLDVAFVNWEIAPSLQFRMGQFKMPMSLEELTSSRFIDFQERSLVNNQVPAKERGLMFHGSPYTGVFYGLALSNGAGKNNNETLAAIDGKDVVGRIGLNAAEIIGNKNMVIHGALAMSDGEQVGGTNISLRTEARGLTFFTQAFTTNSVVERRRTNLEGSFAYGPFKLQGEKMTVEYNGVNSSTAINADLDLYYLEALWMITGESYAESYRNGVYGAIKPLKPFRAAEGNMGAWELGLRMSSADASEFPTPSSGLTREADALTVGLKWIPVTNVRFYLNYVHTKFDRPVNLATGNTNTEKAILFRTGLYF